MVPASVATMNVYSVPVRKPFCTTYFVPSCSTGTSLVAAAVEATAAVQLTAFQQIVFYRDRDGFVGRHVRSARLRAGRLAGGL